ncbi:hypothetical protein BGZ94_000928 [Podila epigama]|nr:hypothetical protein BGZ94_000928 [Podila epigama]
MPSRSSAGGGGGSGLPFFNVGTASTLSGGLGARLLAFSRVPRSCLSPRVFLSCIMVTFTVSWLMMYSYSRVSFGFRTARENEEWLRLENRLQNGRQPWQWSNASLISQFDCQTPARTTTSRRGSGYDRDTICTVQNLCVDTERGVWIHPSKASGAGEFPWANVVAGNPHSDAYFRPSVLDRFPETAYRYVEQTVFVYDLELTASRNTNSDDSDKRDNRALPVTPQTTQPWIMNSLLPLHSIMSSHGGSKSSWFLRVTGKRDTSIGSATKEQQQWSKEEVDTSLLNPLGREIVMDPSSTLLQHQLRPPSKSYPTCFAKAVIGLQSRCTRPHCQNLIGGSELIESLRRNLLSELAVPMIQYQKTDTNIIHPLAGTDVPVVQANNLTILEGESAPRSRIQVALLGRFGNTSVPNAASLELALLARGFAVKTIHFDEPNEISIAQAAQLFRNQSILVAPQGEGLGYATWMQPGSVVISILPRFTRSSKVYTDRMMAFGKRFFAWDCPDESCVQPDRDLVHECIAETEGSDKEAITAQDFEDFVHMKMDFRGRSVVWRKIADCYSKDVSRRVNVEELTKLIEKVAADFGSPETSARDAKRRAVLLKRGVEGDEDGEGDQEEGSEVATRPKQGEDDEQEDNSSDDNEDLDEHGEIRIQQTSDTPKGQGQSSSSTEEEEEDINIHEYDPEASDETEEQSTPSQSSQSYRPYEAPPGKAKGAAAVVDSTKDHENNGKTKGWENLPRMQDAVPLLSFPEYCKRGLCCGAVLGSAPAETAGTSKALTPCAASMATIVLGSNGVWGQSAVFSSPAEVHSLVWQVDLGRK